MFFSLFHWMTGYFIIHVYGSSVERLMNLAGNQQLYLWNIVQEKEFVQMNISKRMYPFLVPCARKTDCHIDIAKEKGFPFLLKKYDKRQFFLVGGLIFMLFLFILSSFIWEIDVSGYERLKKEEILQFCEQNGLKNGSLKRFLNAQDISEQLILHFKDISWAAIDIQGTKANIQIVETISSPLAIEKSEPCHVIAAKSAVIESVISKKGTLKVKRKDVVHQGDILISSEVIAKAEETPVHTYYVHAEGEVYGKRWYEVVKSIPLSFETKKFTKKKTKERKIDFFGMKVQQKKKIKFTHYVILDQTKQITLFNKFKLPVIIDTKIYKEYILIPHTRTSDEAEELAKEVIAKGIETRFDVDVVIEKKEFETEMTDNQVIVKCLLTTIERIDEKAKLTNMESLEAVQ